MTCSAFLVLASLVFLLLSRVYTLAFMKANQIAVLGLSCNLASDRAATTVYTMPAGSLALANENTVQSYHGVPFVSKFITGKYIIILRECCGD